MSISISKTVALSVCFKDGLPHVNSPNRIDHLTAAEARPLRRQILRPDQPREACIYPDDDHPDTRHFGYFSHSRLVGVASVYHQSPNDRSDPDSWRIRGMAVLPEARARSFGAALLKACIAYTQTRNGVRIWCNARIAVKGFYAKYGFQIEGNPFDLPAIGPHYQMVFQRLPLPDTPLKTC